MKIVVEEKVAYLRGELEKLASVESVAYLPAAAITPEAVRDADALIVRTRTRCDSSLLALSRVKLVGTATIGTDHIDIPWCEANGIRVVSAPGCNAPAVNQYVWQSLEDVGVTTPTTIGIIGIGNVGRLVAAEARRRGWRVLLNDPPRAAAEGPEDFVDLDEIAREADVVTVHTPLDSTTRHLLSTSFFSSLKRKPVVINAARGGIVDEAALLRAMDDGRVREAVIDCWEGEPNGINAELLRRAAVATPHIAGYSIEGKRRAAEAMIRAVAGLPPVAPMAEAPAPDSFSLKEVDAALRARPEAFDAIRNAYPLRHE